MFGVDVLTYKPQIDPIVLDFPIFPALGNGGAQYVDFGSGNRRKLGVSPKLIQGVLMNTHVGDKIFADTQRLRENRPRAVEKSVVGKEKKTDKLECWQLTCQFQTIQSSARSSSELPIAATTNPERATIRRRG